MSDILCAVIFLIITLLRILFQCHLMAALDLVVHNTNTRRSKLTCERPTKVCPKFPETSASIQPGRQAMAFIRSMSPNSRVLLTQSCKFAQELCPNSLSIQLSSTWDPSPEDKTWRTPASIGSRCRSPWDHAHTRRHETQQLLLYGPRITQSSCAKVLWTCASFFVEQYMLSREQRECVDGWTSNKCSV